MARNVSSKGLVGEFDLIEVLEQALSLARKDRSALTAHLLEMAILNESRGILEHVDTDGQA